MIRAVVYFHGPKTAWSRKIAEAEIVAEKTLPVRWVARMWARNIAKQLSSGRCGWALVDDVGTELEQSPAENQDLA